MNEISLKVPLFDFTPINNIFIDEYLKDSRGEFVKVYLFCLRAGYIKNDISIKEISDSLNLLQTDVMKSLEYWEEKGLMRLHSEGSIELLPFNSPVKQSSNDDVCYDANTKEMFSNIEKIVARPLSPKEIDTYVSWINGYNLSPELITLLVEYCSARKKTDIRYIEKVALSWHDSNILTLLDAQNYITKHEEKWNKYRDVLNFMGMKDTEIAKPQEEIMDKWLETYGFSTEIIKEASRICIMRINEPNFSYIEAILAAWYKDGVKNLSDVRKNDKKPKQKKRTQPIPGASKNQRQYDPKELEKQLLGRGDLNEQ